MLKKFYCVLLITLVSLSAFSTDAQRYKDVFTESIYALDNVDEKTSEEEIAKQLTANKRSCVEKKTQILRERLDSFCAHNQKLRVMKRMSYAIMATAAVGSAVARREIRSTFSVGIISFTVVEALFRFLFGEEISESHICALKNEIDAWFDGLEKDPLVSCEQAYLCKKHQGLVAKDLQKRIEQILLHARDDSTNVADAEHFVLLALRLPIKVLPVSSIKVPEQFLGLCENNQSVINHIVSDVMRAATVAKRGHSDVAKLRHLHVVVGIFPVGESFAKSIADLCKLPFHDFLPDALTTDAIYGEKNKAGELLRSFTMKSENALNVVVNVDFDYLCRLGKNADAVINKLVRIDSYDDEFLGASIDLSKMHIFIATSGRNQERLSELESLAEDLAIDVLRCERRD